VWVKIDDGFHRHPKARAAGKDGRALFVASLCSSSAAKADGYVPAHDLPVIAAEAEVRAKPTAARLVDVGLWHGPDHDCPHCDQPTGPGWMIHDFLVYQPSCASQAAKSAARAEAGRKGGRASGESRKATAKANASANDEQERTPSPVPPLVTSQSSTQEGYSDEPTDDEIQAEADRRLAAVLATGREIPNPGGYRAAIVASLYNEQWQPGSSSVVIIPPYPIPDADEWIAEQRDIPVSRPPEGWREQMRSAEV
jgi:hypothetical protein